MQNSLIKLAIGTAFFILTIIVAVIGYIFFGWTTLEAVYMVVITIFGVGYGEVQPLETPAEKIFTILVILAGTSSALYIVGGFVQMVAEGEITRAFDAQRKQNTIASLENHVIICGFGRIAQVMAYQLAAASQLFVVIDSDPQRIAMAESQGFLVKVGDATDESVLAAAGIQQAQFVATVLPEDATNVFITLTARELNPHILIIARGELPSTEKKLRLAGANHVILPATVSGIQMANLVTGPSSTDFLQQKDQQNSLNDLLNQIEVQIDELTLAVDSPLVGRTIRELEIRGKGAFIIVALRRNSGEFLSHPHPSLILNSQDTLIAIGHQDKLPKFARYYQLNHSLHQRQGSTRVLN
ncbi:MAG: NAD-binding protein [Cyanobacteria bacterium J06621_8]